jgi:hypothetical protein
MARDVSRRSTVWVSSAARLVFGSVFACAALLPMGAMFSAQTASARTVPPPPPDPATVQTAFSLLDNTGYATALGEPVAGPEDDGGTDSGFDTGRNQRTEARVLSASGLKFDVQLFAFPDAGTALDQYNTLTANYSQGVALEPLPGVGDQAAYVETTVFVLRGAQILQVDISFTGAAEEQLDEAKSSAADFDAILTFFYRRVIPVGQALGPTLSGAPVSVPQTLLPAAARDACAGEPTLAASIFGADATASPSQSERNPATMCILSGGGETVFLFVLTEGQLTSSLTPSTAADKYAADLASAQASPNAPLVAANGLSFTTTLPEVSAEALVTGPSGQNYVVTALVPGSFSALGNEAPFAASLATLVAGTPAAVEAPPPPPTTLPAPTTVPAPTTTIVPTTATVPATLGSVVPGSVVSGAAAAPPTVSALDSESSDTASTVAGAAPVVSTTSKSSGGSSTAVVVVVLLVAAAIGATVFAVRRRRMIVGAAVHPDAVGVPGPVDSRVLDLEGSWNIGVAAVPGPSQQTVVMEDTNA